MQTFRRQNEEPDKQFKPFHITYDWITTCLIWGLMYPNPSRDKARLILVVTTTVVVMPILLTCIHNMISSLLQGDEFNLIRQSTVVGPFVLSLLKMYLMYYKRTPMKALIDEMNRDFEIYNQLPRRYQIVVASSIKDSKMLNEWGWCTAITVAMMCFPVVALGATMLSHIFEETPRRYMSHEMVIPFQDPAVSYETPYYEVVFAYTVYAGCIMVINFAGYDGLFGLTTNHACLKINVYCMYLEDAFNQKTDDDIYEGVMKFIDEQKRLFKFHALIQDVFNTWLGIILVCTMVQVGSLLFHITAGYGFDLRYMLFSVCSVFHIFLPCKNAASVKTMSMESATRIYCSGWEKVHSLRVCRMLPFMVARAQIPLVFTAFYLFQYDMELFVTIMKTSYSLFTLMES